MRRHAIVFVIVMSLATGWTSTHATPSIIETEVSFQVVNDNTSRTAAACTPDGKTYTVRGVLAAPSDVLVDGPDDAVALYLHGSGDGSEWNFTGFPDVDHIGGMAELGHVSAFMHMLGYGTSDPVDGNDLCAGSWATMAHQVVQQLRAGTYDASGQPTPAFERVMMAGHSGGALLATLYSVSYDDIDALALAGWADLLVDYAPLFVGAGRLGAACVNGGRSKQTGGPVGWARLFKEEELDHLLFNVDPAVKRAFFVRYEDDFCGLVNDVGPLLASNIALSPAVVTIPVLLMYGDHDPFLPGSFELERRRYLSSDDVTLKVLPNAGHNWMMGNTAAEGRAFMSQWLKARGF